MRNDDLWILRACLPARRMIFPYFKDRYALLVLARAAGEGASTGQLRCGPCAALLDKPIVRRLLAACGDGRITARALEGYRPDKPVPYRLTLGKWSNPRNGDNAWYQTSRPGTNLVLQLNFNRDHDRAYRRLLGLGEDDPFRWESHPVAPLPKLTLAWVRLDIDLERREALVEEVQSDWVREALQVWRAVRRASAKGRNYVLRRELCNNALKAARFHEYVETHLAPHAAMWDEAALAAALWLLWEKIGIRRVYYHTYDGGRLLKECEPPRSVYTALPRRFCFRETDQPPRMIAACRSPRVRRILTEHPVRWFVQDW